MPLGRPAASPFRRRFMASYYLGIDGGGTRTRAWLADETGHLLRSQRGRSRKSPPPRHRSRRPKPRRPACRHSVVATTTIGDSPPAACGLAGVTGAETRLTRILRDLLPPGTPLLLTSDARIALTAAPPPVGPGAILVSGTGVDLPRPLKRRGPHRPQGGGRGPLLDDAGSARWIGRRALETAARQSDGRQPGRQILDAVRGFYAAAENRRTPLRRPGRSGNHPPARPA